MCVAQKIEKAEVAIIKIIIKNVLFSSAAET